MQFRKFVTELLGTAIFVFLGVGILTMSFGFGLFGLSPAAGVVMTALGFGLVLLALAYAIGPISGCHVNPAVTLGFVLSRRMAVGDAIGYWIAQFVGGIIGALALWAVFQGVRGYSVARAGLGVVGWGAHSMANLSLGSAFAVEIILTFVFVLIVLAATSHAATASFGGLAIGLGLTIVHLFGIPLTWAAVNPARSLGPALIVGGDALRQVWLFLVAPLIGGAIAAVVARALIGGRRAAAASGRAPGPEAPAA